MIACRMGENRKRFIERGSSDYNLEPDGYSYLVGHVIAMDFTVEWYSETNQVAPPAESKSELVLIDGWNDVEGIAEQVISVVTEGNYLGGLVCKVKLIGIRFISDSISLSKKYAQLLTQEEQS